MTITVSQLTIYFISSLAISLLAKHLLGVRYSLGPFETVLAGLVNAWAMMDVLHISVAPQIGWNDVAVVLTAGGLIGLAFVWIVLTEPVLQDKDA